MTNKGKACLFCAALLLALSTWFCGGGGSGFPIKGIITDKDKIEEIEAAGDYQSINTTYRVTVENDSGPHRFSIRRDLYNTIAIGQVCEFKNRQEALCR